MTLQEPFPNSNRIEIIDIIRGFTLFGIILIHMVEQYYAGPLPEKYEELANQEIGNMIVMGFVSVFILGKFYMIFSFLFGLSFYIQLSKTSGNGTFLARFAWRLVILFIIGLLHHLHYRGDILTIYAILGFGLLLFYRLPDRYLLIIGILLILNVPSMIMRAINVISPTNANPFGEQNQDDLLHYYNLFKSGPYIELLKANFYDFKDKMDFQLISGRIYITFGLFLLGLYAGRKKFFENISHHLSWIKKVSKRCYWTIGGSLLTAIAFFAGAQVMGMQLSEQVSWFVGGALVDIFNAALAFLYIGWIIQLYKKTKWQSRLMVFYAPGRMGLTTYLMQSLFGLLIFSCMGLGLIGLSKTISIALAVFLFIIQIAFSNWWLMKFHYGFFEWLWRTLTDFKVARFLKPGPNIA